MFIRTSTCPGGGIGRHNRLKICRPKGLRVQVPFRVPVFSMAPFTVPRKKSRQPLEKILFSPRLSFLFLQAVFCLLQKTALFTIGGVALRYSTFGLALLRLASGLRPSRQVPFRNTSFYGAVNSALPKADSRLRKFYFPRCCLFFLDRAGR